MQNRSAFYLDTTRHTTSSEREEVQAIEEMSTAGVNQYNNGNAQYTTDSKVSTKLNGDLNLNTQQTDLFVETKKVTITERGVAAMEIIQSNHNKQDAEVNTSKVTVPI